MAYTAPRTSNGFEKIGNLHYQPDPGRYYELTPSLAVKAGDMVVLTGGFVAKAAAGATNVLGVAAESVTASATVPTLIRVYDNPYNVYRCTFVDHQDLTATAGSTTTIVAQLAIHDTDDDPNGTFIWCYEGPNKGVSRTVTDYAHGTDTLTFLAMPNANTTATKFIVLGECDDAGTSVVNVGTPGVNLKDENRIDANAATDAVDGPLACLAIHPEDLMMDVVIIKHVYNSR